MSRIQRDSFFKKCTEAEPHSGFFLIIRMTSRSSGEKKSKMFLKCVIQITQFFHGFFHKLFLASSDLVFPVFGAKKIEKSRKTHFETIFYAINNIK